jgi:hypothetical protein
MTFAFLTYRNLVSHDARRIVRSVLATTSPIGLRTQDLFRQIRDQFPSERTPIYAAHVSRIPVSSFPKGKGKNQITHDVATDPEAQPEAHPILSITYAVLSCNCSVPNFFTAEHVNISQ